MKGVNSISRLPMATIQGGACICDFTVIGRRTMHAPVPSKRMIHYALFIFSALVWQERYVHTVLAPLIAAAIIQKIVFGP